MPHLPFIKSIKLQLSMENEEPLRLSPYLTLKDLL